MARRYCVVTIPIPRPAHMFSTLFSFLPLFVLRVRPCPLLFILFQVSFVVIHHVRPFPCIREVHCDSAVKSLFFISRLRVEEGGVLSQEFLGILIQERLDFLVPPTPYFYSQPRSHGPQLRTKTDYWLMVCPGC
jgi:hypothetical protein